MRVELSHVCLLMSVGLLLFLCPYTKVEESFNMQAAHDLIELVPLMEFDHLSFPGVVPRTFLGPLTLSALALPVHRLLQLMGASKFLGQYLIRGILGCSLWLSFVEFLDGIKVKFKSGRRLGDLCAYLTAIQFHLPFYMSRTLPNTFALFGCLIAYAQWLKGRPVRCLCVLAVFMIIFRCDLLVLLAPLVVQMLFAGEVPFFSTLVTGIVTCVIALAVTVGVDSHFWQRGWLWPEGEVLFFNTVQNKSSEWGVFPWHWYATSAIPRALNVSVIFAFVGLTGIRLLPESMSESRMPRRAGEATRRALPWFQNLAHDCIRVDEETRLLWYYVCPVMIFLALYSLLPHKELRFVFPALPVLNLAAAKGLALLIGASQGPEDAQILEKGNTASALAQLVRKWIRRIARWSTQGLVFTGMMLYFIFLVPSTRNYPGGIALHRLLHSHVAIQKVPNQCLNGNKGCPAALTVKVHIDADAAMTGVTRFGQSQPAINRGFTMEYSKDEDLPRQSATYRQFDWLLTSSPTAPFKADFEVVEEVLSFWHFDISFREATKNLHGMLTGTICPIRIDKLAPLKMRLKPSLWIMKNSKSTRI